MDILEWVLFLNTWSSVLYKLVLGDKDLWEVAFMLAGKHRLFYRIPVQPRSAMTILQDVSLCSSDEEVCILPLKKCDSCMQGRKIAQGSLLSRLFDMDDEKRLGKGYMGKCQCISFKKKSLSHCRMSQHMHLMQTRRCQPEA